MCNKNTVESPEEASWLYKHGESIDDVHHQSLQNRQVVQQDMLGKKLRFEKLENNFITNFSC